MRFYKVIKISTLLIVVFSLLSCTSKTSSSIKEIKNIKKSFKKSNINIDNKYDFIAYIDKKNRINFLCYTNNISLKNYTNCKCKYYNPEKHSYKNFLQSEEILTIGKDGYSPLTSPNKLLCGKGSVYGWISFLGIENMEIKDYTALNKEGCRYRFTKVDEPLIIERVFGGIYTFMTSFITAGNLHLRKFDEDAFIDAIHDSNVDSYKNKIYDAIDGYTINGGFDMVYLESENYASDLADKYDNLLIDNSKKAGVIFLDKDTNELLSITVFDKYKEYSIIKAISMQIEDLRAQLASANQEDIKEEDIKKYIPKEIALPKLPEVPSLTKSEYEKKAEFDLRVEEAVAQREATVRDLQREYSSSVLERNNYISKLEVGYKQYLKEFSKIKQKNINEFQDNLALLTKILFLENISGYEAKEFQYNAETKQLFFGINSTHGGYSQKVVAKVPPSSAKNIKEKTMYKIIPAIRFKNGQLQLNGFELLDITSNYTYEVNYTDINYIPETVKIEVRDKKEHIDPKITRTFLFAKQQDLPIVDTSKQEIWYVDIANRLNARIPKWFLQPEYSNHILAFGEGNTLSDAKHQARNELAMLLSTSISTRLDMHEIVNNFKHSHESVNSSTQSSNIELKADSYSVYKQERVDGKWYVALKYTGI